MTSEEIWRNKGDEEVVAAMARLEEYTELGQQVILAEAASRGLPIEEARRRLARVASIQAQSGRPLEHAEHPIGNRQPRQRVLLPWESPAIRVAGRSRAYDAPQMCVGCGTGAALTTRRVATRQLASLAVILVVVVASSVAFYPRLGPIGVGILTAALVLFRFLVFRPRSIAVSYSQCASCLTAEKRDRERATLRFFVLSIASAAAGMFGGVVADESKGSPVLVGVFGLGGVALMLVLFAWAVWSLAGLWRSRRLVTRGTRGGLVLAARSAGWVERVRNATSGLAAVDA
jgi:hypothetical protein